LSPAIFHPGTSTGQAIALNEDGTLNSLSNPAPRGSIVALWGTGGGQFNPAGVTGGLNPLNALGGFPQAVHVGIGNFLPRADAEVLYAGPSPGASSGVFQVNFRIPTTLVSAITFLNVTIAGTVDTDTVYDTWIVVK
jgi:uncharacterized protein (TIGR03437 family)